MGELFTVPVDGSEPQRWGTIDDDGVIRSQSTAPWLPVLVLACDDLGRLSARLYRPSHLDGSFACPKCGAPVVPCDACGNPAQCGDAWCQQCQPDG